MKITGLLALVGVFAGLSTGIATRPTTIVAKRQFVNQTGPIAPVNLFTPPHDGDYRISGYLSSPSCSNVDGQTAVEEGISWTDTTVPLPWTFGVLLQCGQFPNSIYSQGSVVVHAKAGTTISVKIPYHAGEGTLYSAYITVETLQ